MVTQRISKCSWTPMEDFILNSCYKTESIESLLVKLPNRTASAIQQRMYGLRICNNLPRQEPKPRQEQNMNEFNNTKTIEGLEIELKLRKAQAEYDAAQQRYAIFAEQCRIAFPAAMRSDTTLTLDVLFKQNSKEFAKLNAAISNAARKLLGARVEANMAV